MNISLVEPFFTGSHRQWALGLQKYSQHNITIHSLPGRFWKWRMHGAAITLAKRVNNLSDIPDLIIVTDMLDVALFRSLLGHKFQRIPFLLYFHENQITYPWSKDDPDPGLQRDRHYGFINYSSCLVADHIAFNSLYHRESFLKALDDYLLAMPDHRNMETVSKIKEKSSVLYLGVDLVDDSLLTEKSDYDGPAVLWNHRWEYDKNPDLFFTILSELVDEGTDFGLIVCGEHAQKVPPVFEEAKVRFEKQIIHFGYVEDRIEYLEMLSQADVLPVTSIQDFFGISIVEAISAGVYPILPNRLVYPEHIPEALRGETVYDTVDELKDKLKDYISSFPDVSKQTDLQTIQQYIDRYAWPVIINEYDDLFSRLVD